MEEKTINQQKGVKVVEGRRVWDKNVFYGKEETWQQSEKEFSTDEKRKEKKPLEARSKAIDLQNYHGKKTALQPNVEKVNEGAFKCETCAVSFTDSESFIDHRNSKSHLNNLGMLAQAKRSTLDDVKNKLSNLPKKKKKKKVKNNKDEDGDDVEKD